MPERLSASFTSPENENDKPTEKCAVVGVANFNGESAREDVIRSLANQNHRGQDGAGGAAYHPEGYFSVYKRPGLVHTAFEDREAIANVGLDSPVMIGHTRYATVSGRKDDPTCLQPYVLSWEGHSLAIAHNGNIPNFQLGKLIQTLPDDIPLQSNTDSELLGWSILTAEGNSWQEKIAEGLKDVPGAYSLTIATDSGELMGIRDPHSIRPLVIGYRPEGVILSSETRGFEYMGVKEWEEVEGGQLITVKDGAVYKDQVLERQATKRCIFEPMYFAHPNSKERKTSETNAEMRRKVGAVLAKEYPLPDVDIICGVPDSGNAFAEGYAEELGRSAHNSTVVKDRYEHGIRTFIQPEQKMRTKGVGYKFSVSPDVAGKSVLCTDDSMVRGTTINRLALQLRDMGATEVHFRFGLPPVTGTCDMGIDLAREDELIALERTDEGFRQRTIEEIRQIAGVDSAEYVTLEDLLDVLGDHDYCTHCLTREHPFHSDPKAVIKPLTFYPSKSADIPHVDNGEGVAKIIFSNEK